MSRELETYDLEAVYDAEIAPLMSRIIEICMEHKIPMMATFAYSHDGERGTGMCTTSIPFKSRTPQQMIDAVAEIYAPDGSAALAAFLVAAVEKGGE